MVQVTFLAQRFEYIINHYLADAGLTTKQLIVLATIEKEFDEAPSLIEVADKLKVSYQNVKQIVTLLEKKGFIQIVRDTKDKRTYRLVTTEYNDEYWRKRTPDDSAVIKELFTPLNEEEQRQFHVLLDKLIKHNDVIYDTLKK